MRTTLEACYFFNGIFKIKRSKFCNNSVSHGDLIFSYSSTAIIKQSAFKNNIGQQRVLYFSSSRVTINISEFYNNNVGYGSVVTSSSSYMSIKGNTFDYNSGIALEVINSNSIIDQSTFKHNIGAALLISANTKVKVTTSEFEDNRNAGSTRQCIDQRLVLGCNGSTTQLINCNFTNNRSPVIAAFDSVIEYFDSLLIMNNTAENEYAVIHLYNSEFIGHDSGNATIYIKQYEVISGIF